jgi:hypothetical protein
VELPLRAHDLAYWDETRNAWTVEADRVRVAVGSSSADLKADKTIQVAR